MPIFDPRITTPIGLVEFRWFGSGTPATLSLPEQIASRLGDRIIGDDIKPGNRIVEQDLADEFRVSRGPIREALRILEREGLVRISPRRGASVTLLSETEVRDIFEIRAGLYRIVAQRNAEMRPPELVDVYRQSLEALEQLAADPEGGDAYAAAVFRLSLTTARAAGNERLTEMITSLSLQTYRYSRLGLKAQSRRRRSVTLWREALEALEGGEIEKVSELAVRRIEESRDAALRLLASQRNPATESV